MSLPKSARVKMAERLLRRLDADGFTTESMPGQKVYVRPEPPVGTQLDLLSCKREVRELVQGRDRTAGALLEAAHGVGLDFYVRDGELVLLWPEIPEGMSAGEIVALFGLLREHEPALVSRLRRTGLEEV